MQIPRDAPLVYVSFSAEINPNTTESLINVMTTCTNANAQSVYLLISTPGGSVMHGLNLYNVLRSQPFEITTHNVGNVDSIGNAVFLAGTKRYATSNATFMFHGVGFNAQQQQRFEEKELRQRLESVLSDQRRSGGIIAQHTNLNAKQVAQLFRQAQVKDAKYAMGKGIIQDIRDVQIPSGCPIISLVFKR